MASNARKETTMANREARPGESTRNRGSRTLPYPEYIRRRKEGRCFHCGGAYTLGHRCPEKNLRVIICAEEEGDLGEENCHDEKEERGNPEMDLSIFSVGGLTQPHSMKLQGTVEGRTALVLIDNGASHNFISTELVSQLSLNIEATLTYTVRLGDGYKKTASGCCLEVEV